MKKYPVDPFEFLSAPERRELARMLLMVQATYNGMKPAESWSPSCRELNALVGAAGLVRNALEEAAGVGV